MLARKYRLPGYLIPKALALGKKVHTPLFTLFIVENEKLDLTGFHLAVIISAKKIKPAVLRNKIRRQIHAIINAYLLKINPNYTVIFLVSGASAHSKFSSRKSEVEFILSKENILLQ